MCWTLYCSKKIACCNVFFFKGNKTITVIFLSVINVGWSQAQIEVELDRHWDRLHQGLSYYKPPRYSYSYFHIKFTVVNNQKVTASITCYSSSSAEKVKEKKDVAQPLRDFGLRISKLLVRLQNVNQE